jgi:hypothetical protein
MLLRIFLPMPAAAHADDDAAAGAVDDREMNARKGEERQWIQASAGGLDYLQRPRASSKSGSASIAQA